MLLLGVVISSAEPTEAPPDAEPTPDDLQALDELDESVDLLFEDFDVVVTAGRTAQPINMAAVPVSVLTTKDIHLSGVTSIPQLFDFIPGMDALQIDRNLWSLGVRGLHQEFSDRTLLLVNGRTESSAFHGGIDLQLTPLFIEDIERIEVVRGPGGAAWGANAFNGVINIIEKSPRDTAGVFATSTLNEFGDTFNHIRLGIARDDFAFRLSGGFDDTETSENAVSQDTFSSRDFSRIHKFDFDGVYDFSGATTLEFGAGYAHVERGDFPFLGLQPGIDERIDAYRWYAKLSHQFSESVEGYAQWYGAYEDLNRPSITRYSNLDNTLDAQIRLAPAEAHELTFGVTGRLVRIDADMPRASDLLPDRTFHEQWFGLYGIHNWVATDRVTFETQLRGDWYSETTFDWSGRLALLLAADDEKRHVFRLAAAKAFRAPQASIQEISTTRLPLPSPPFPPRVFGATLIQTANADNEQIYSLEAGYAGRFDEHWTWRIDGYLQRYRDLTGATTFPDPFGAGLIIAQIGNESDADARGIETELKFEADRILLSGWLAVNDFDIHGDTTHDARAFLPAKHKAGARARIELLEWWTVNANYRYTGVTPVVAEVNIREYHRLDLSTAFSIAEGRAEFSLGVIDLFDDTDIAIDSISGGDIFHETPGRTLFARLQIKF